MNNQLDLNQPTLPLIPPPSPVTPSDPDHYRRSIITTIIMAMVVLLLLVVSSYLYLQNRSLRTQLSLNTFTPPVTSTDPSEDDPFANWQVYTDLNNNYVLKYPPNWQNLESACQKIEITTSKEPQQEMDIREIAKKVYGLSDTLLEEFLTNASEKYFFTLPKFNRDEYLILGPLGEAEINNIVVIDPIRRSYANITVWFNGNPFGDNTLCSQQENDYQKILSTFQFTSSHSDKISQIKQECIQIMGVEIAWDEKLSACIDTSGKSSELYNFCNLNKGEYADAARAECVFDIN